MGSTKGAAQKGKAEKRAAKRAAAQAEKPVPDYVAPADPPRAVMALHPDGQAVAVAVGPELRLFDAKTGQVRVLISKPEPEAAAATEAAPQQQPPKGQQQAAPLVRGVAFDASGRHLLVGSEAKAAGMRLWDCATWELLQTIKVPKKVTTCAFTADGRHMMAADKFGDVLVAATDRPAGLEEGREQEAQLLLGHYCAILTSLSLGGGGRLLATTDRDHRVRVSIVPADPLGGAHEIRSFCHGHTAFVTCSAFVQQGGQELLASGGGDGTLRLWDPLSGQLLHTLQLPAPAQPAGGEAAGGAAAEQLQGQPQEQGGEEGGSSGSDDEAAGEGAAAGGPPEVDAAVPLALAASPDGSWLVAAVDGWDELCLVAVDWAARQLREVSWAALPGLHLPACLVFGTDGLLWAAGGPVADDSTAAFLACGTVAAGEGAEPHLAPVPLPAFLPADAARQLAAQTGEEAALLAAAAERRRLASQLLQRRRYSLAQLEHRKRARRDRKAAADAVGAGEA